MPWPGKKMGKDPEKLREQMQSGQMDGILGGLSPAQRAQIQGFMNNPAGGSSSSWETPRSNSCCAA